MNADERRSNNALLIRVYPGASDFGDERANNASRVAANSLSAPHSGHRSGVARMSYPHAGQRPRRRRFARRLLRLMKRQTQSNGRMATTMAGNTYRTVNPPRSIPGKARA